jgi:hypothetical protein
MCGKAGAVWRVDRAQVGAAPAASAALLGWGAPSRRAARAGAVSRPPPGRVAAGPGGRRGAARVPAATTGGRPAPPAVGLRQRSAVAGPSCPALIAGRGSGVRGGGRKRRPPPARAVRRGRVVCWMPPASPPPRRWRRPPPRRRHAGCVRGAPGRHCSGPSARVRFQWRVPRSAAQRLAFSCAAGRRVERDEHRHDEPLANGVRLTPGGLAEPRPGAEPRGLRRP